MSNQSDTEPNSAGAFGVATLRLDRKARILRAIAEHLRIFGRKEWDRVREHPDFAPIIGKVAGEKGRRKFWRWVNAVSEPAPLDKTRPHEARQVAADALDSATDRARLAAQENLPTAPSPAYLMRAGAGASRNIDFLAGIHLIWADAQRLREHSMLPDETAPEGMRISDAKLFDASIRRRVEVIESAVGIIWDLEYQQRFYDGITDIIVDELASVPAIQERVIRRLVELNKSRGMTASPEAR